LSYRRTTLCYFGPSIWSTFGPLFLWDLGLDPMIRLRWSSSGSPYLMVVLMSLWPINLAREGKSTPWLFLSVPKA